MNALVAASGGRLAANAGGVLILDAEGRGIGAMGISGDMGDKDESCTIAGLEAAWLKYGA